MAFQVELEIVAIQRRLLVRLPSWVAAAAVRGAGTAGVTAWRLDRLAFRAVLTRRLRAVAALVEAPAQYGGGGAGTGLTGSGGAPSMAGFSAELQKLITAGNEAMSGKKQKGARVDPGVRAVLLSGWGDGNPKP